MQVRKQQLELDMEQQIGSKWGKEYVRAVSRAEGLRFLHGLESNPGSSLQTEEEAGLP